MDDLIAVFFDRNFEDSVTEKMLEFDYEFPVARMEDYVISVAATPYRQFVDFVHDSICPTRISSAADIPQISSYDVCTYGVCKMMNAIGDPGVTVYDFGRFLYPNSKKHVKYEHIEAVTDEAIDIYVKTYGALVVGRPESCICLDGKERKKQAIVKIAENQLKGAAFHGLVYELGGKWFLTCLGKVYATLDMELQHALSARTLLRNPFFWRVISEAVDHEIDIMPYVTSVCSGSTIERRRTSCMHFLDICTEAALSEGVVLHPILAPKQE